MPTLRVCRFSSPLVGCGTACRSAEKKTEEGPHVGWPVNTTPGFRQGCAFVRALLGNKQGVISSVTRFDPPGASRVVGLGVPTVD